MNKTALKNFAVRARRKLIEDVAHKAYEIGITGDKPLKSDTFDGGSMVRERENGQVLSSRETKNRGKLIQVISDKGFEQVMEEVAYTWFNRFIALRFMEVNDYLPGGVRVLSSLREGKKEPDIIQQALTVDLGLDHNTVYELRDEGNTAELYKYLLSKQCNQLGQIMSDVFEPIADYTELLLPDNLLGEGSITRDLVESIEEYDWKIDLSDAELAIEEEKGDHGSEIIGWLYQYYISEKKDEVFAALKKNIKITKENIPAATQLFTPKWIVKYMIENSLGRLWLESHPNEELQTSWKYYLEEAEQEPEVQKQLEELKNPNLRPIDIKLLDPATGSGHILVYAFDLLYDIYLSAGYSEKDIPKLILENNLYGLEIDDRAIQLASFALYMKARSKDKKIFDKMPKLNLCSIQESNGISDEAIDYFVGVQGQGEEGLVNREEMKYLVEVFHDAKEYGSILEVKAIDYDALEKRVEQVRNEYPADILEMQDKQAILEKVAPLVKQGRIMSMKYDVVCTNPPYMGRKGLNPKLYARLTKKYYDSKSDMSAVFIEVSYMYSKENSFFAIINQHSWMFLSRFDKLREKIMFSNYVRNMAHLGQHAFEGIAGEVVQTTSYIMRNKRLPEHKGIYLKLTDWKNHVKKEKLFLDALENKGASHVYKTKISRLGTIPGKPFAYWVSDNLIDSFKNGDLLKELGETRKGMVTRDNDYFVRLWYEVSLNKICFDASNRDQAKMSNCKWFPYQKAGNFKKWWGNNIHIVNWYKDGTKLLNMREHGFSVDSTNHNLDYIFKKAIVWNKISSENFCARISDNGYLFDDASPFLFINNLKHFYVLAFMNTNVFKNTIALINPTMNFGPGNVGNVPLLINQAKYCETEKLSLENVRISKTDWDSFETSWDFQTHPLLTQKNGTSNISQAYQNWADFTETQFNQLKQNEEELNRIFIDIYGLQDELTPEVEDKDITINKADRERDIKSFLSYAVGCTFGRYSLDQDGLIYAGGDFADKFKYNNNAWEINAENGWVTSSIAVEKDNIIPIVDDDYFENDIVKRVVDFVKAAFGEATLEENLNYIAESLGNKTGETARQTIRRYFMKDFYKDHIRTYKKRPIYWLFDSGKQNGFKALIYMHRYDPLTVARVRTDYLHRLQKNYEAVNNQHDLVIKSEASEREKAAARKNKDKILKQIEECRYYDQVIAHVANQRIVIDLDDGVKVNYAKFQDIEVPLGEGRKPLKANLLAKI